jgi:hypothetical protein
MRPTPPQAISSSATAAQGLRVKAALDENVYDAGIKAGNTEPPRQPSSETSFSASGTSESGLSTSGETPKCSGHCC